VCVSVASVLCVHHALYNLATLGMGIATDGLCLSLVSQFSVESARKLTTRLPTPCFPLVMSPFVSLQKQFSQEFSQTLQYIPFSAAVAGTGQVSLPGADVFRQVTACHWPN